MNTRTRGVMIRVMCLMVGVSLLTGMAEAETTTLADLPLPAQAAISEAIGQDLDGYRIRATQIGGEADNAGHGFIAYFDGAGMTIRSGAEVWRFELMQWGYGAALQPVAEAAPEIIANRVTLRRDALTEWFVNGPSGVQQGFTLRSPPTGTTGTELLTLVMRLTGTDSATIEPNQRDLILGKSGLRYAGLYVYDAIGQNLQAWFELDGETLLIRVDDREAQYPLTIDPWVQQQKLTVNNGDDYDYFGTSVSVSGDTAIVGAYQASANNNSCQGAAYVFVHSGSTWIIQQKLTASDGAAYDWFGRSVAISGDTAVVGADGVNVGANTDQGAAYVFIHSDGIWSEQGKLMASDGAANDEFGKSVTVDGGTTVVGAPYATVGVNYNQGAAYVFVRNSEVWSQQKKLTAGDGVTGDRFGTSVAVSEDTVVIGAPSAAITSNYQGAAYVFVRSNSIWAQQWKLTSGDGMGGDWFGESVAISGDTAVIGAFGAYLGGNGGQGAAYVFVRGGSIWSQQAKLTASDGAEDDWFGRSVAISGNTALVSTYYADISGTTDQGAAYVFIRSGNTWLEQAKLSADDGMANDYFSVSVAISEDTAVIGAPSRDINGNINQGAAYMFVRIGSVWSQQQGLMAGGAPNDEFGYSVAVSGDTMVVGADEADVDGTIDQGAAYVFVRSGSVWSQQGILTANDGAANDLFGLSVALSDDTAVIGAPYANIGSNSHQGAAYVFVRNDSVWSQQAKLTADDGAANDEFGVSVALSGDTAVVGVHHADIGGASNRGAAYVFVRSYSAWNPQGKLTANDGAAGDLFGISVAVDGDTATVGALYADIGANSNQGAAYVFGRSVNAWSQQTKLTADDGTAYDKLGTSVAISGDTVVTGAYGADVDGTSQGAAYVFVWSGSAWTQQEKLTASDGAASDCFGVSVVVSGDIVVVGADRVNIGANSNQGAAYVFVRSGSTWTQQGKLIANDGSTEDWFGRRVAASGDTAVVGAPYVDIDGTTNQGAVYMFVFDEPINSYLLWTK